jgi:tetratricopeptide (TPR) repeat protein
MMDGGFYLEAISQYNEALAQYPQAWVALEGLARCHGGLGEYQLAIDVMKKAVEAIPESSKSISSYLYTRIMTWGSQIGDDELAYEAAMKGIDADSSNLDAQLRFFEALHARGESERIVRTIQWLNGLTSVDQDYTWLVRFLISGRDAFTEMGKACREEGQPAEIVEAMDEALGQIDLVGDRWMKVWLPLQVAEFRYKFYEQEAEFIKSAETFLERLRRETPKFRADYDDFEIHRKRITNKLAQLYFDFAVAAWDDGKGVAKASAFAHKLKILAVSVPTSFADSYEGFDFFRPDYPALLWGRWQRDYKHAVERIWRKCFRVRLLEEMNSLDDDDPTNDVSGMGSLAISLFHAGDRKDAAAILAILYRPLEHLIAKTKVGGEEGPDEGKGETGVNDPEAQLEALPVKEAGRGLPLDIKDSWGYLCDNCRRDASEAAEMYFCEVCHDLNWCGECLVKVRDPNITPGLREHWCNPNHDFYRAWPIPDEARDLAAEYLDGAIELRREWLERLRGEWLSAGV